MIWMSWTRSGLAAFENTVQPTKTTKSNRIELRPTYVGIMTIFDRFEHIYEV